MELAIARMRITHLAEVAQCREHRFQRQGKDDTALKTPKG
jgi:hypothetical protein